MQKLLLLVDGSSYLFRAYHALPPLTTEQGIPVGAIYGVISMLRKLLTDYQPDYLAVVFDAKDKTFRHNLYAPYKANRINMPDELSQQISPLHNIIKAMGLPLVILSGVEADDVIGTLARHAKEAAMSVVISTSDKDMAQLVDDRITLVNTMTKQILTRDGVKEKFGVLPEQMIDYLTLVGDTSDNIPGVVGIGPKTAVKLLHEYGSVTAIMAHIDTMKGKLAENLRSTQPHLSLYRTLVTIKQDVDLAISFADLTLKTPNHKELSDYFTQFEFKKFLQELDSPACHPVTPSSEYKIILTQSDLDALLTELDRADLIAFDTETTSLDVFSAELVGISFATQPHQAAYIPLAHNYLHAPEQLALHTVINAIKPLLENPDKKIICQNSKYDAKILQKYGIQLTAQFDTMLESYVINSLLRHDLDSLAAHYLQYKTIHYEDVVGKGAKQLKFNEVHIAQATQYAAEDADITLRLHQTLFPQLKNNPLLLKIFTEIEMPLIPVLTRMEHIGVMIDKNLLQQQSVALSKILGELEQETYAVAGCTFNLNSPKQLQAILYETLNIPIVKKTPTGLPSTAEDVLQELALEHRLPQLLLQYRSLSKLKSTYTDALPAQINPVTGRVHTSYHQANTATGRLSSAHPNLQNIPIKTEEGRRIRQAFIVPSGYKLLSADYSQIELRIMAELSGDENLNKAFADNLDVHKATAAEIFDIPLENVSAEQRRNAKAINFGLIYGMSAFGLAQQIGIERHAAQRYINLYFSRYPKVKKYMEFTIEQARSNGYVETYFGRRLYLPEINSKNISRKKMAERTAINAPLQGTAADLIKRAMITIDHWLQTQSIDARMLMQVHDELVFEVSTHDVAWLKENVIQQMIAASTLRVPMVVDVGVGNNWDEAH